MAHMLLILQEEKGRKAITPGKVQREEVEDLHLLGA